MTTIADHQNRMIQITGSPDHQISRFLKFLSVAAESAAATQASA
jgi:hypothetical protein